MNENENNVAVAVQSTEKQWPEIIQDEALLKDWDRAYFKVFKNWSWNLVWNNKYGWKFFVISLITWAIGMLAWFFDAWLSSLLWLEEGVSLSIFRSIVNVVLWVWLVWFSFNIAKWLFQKVDDFFHEITWDRIWKICVSSLVFWLIVFGWLILLVIPWIIFSVRFQFFGYAIVDKWLSPIDALKYSWRITKWRFWEIIWFDFYFVLINLLWMLCLLVGLIWTSAMTNISTARYYRLISNMYEKNLKLWNNVQQA